MAHKTLVGGTAYDIKGGKCLVGGTAYSIQKGRTLVGGTGHDVRFAPAVVPVTITGSGTKTYCCVVINETTYTSEANGLEASVGDVIRLIVKAQSGTATAKIVIDGATVVSSSASQTQTYDWTVPECNSINIDLYNGKANGWINYGHITVTTT